MIVFCFCKAWYCFLFQLTKMFLKILVFVSLVLVNYNNLAADPYFPIHNYPPSNWLHRPSSLTCVSVGAVWMLCAGMVQFGQVWSSSWQVGTAVFICCSNSDRSPCQKRQHILSWHCDWFITMVRCGKSRSDIHDVEITCLKKNLRQGTSIDEVVLRQGIKTYMQYQSKCTQILQNVSNSFAKIVDLQAHL